MVSRDGMMEQLERFLLVASGDELTGQPLSTCTGFFHYKICAIIVAR